MHEGSFDSRTGTSELSSSSWEGLPVDGACVCVCVATKRMGPKMGWRVKGGECAAEDHSASGWRAGRACMRRCVWTFDCSHVGLKHTRLAMSPAGSPVSGSLGGAGDGQFDVALANYGIQLRAWIDLQVDARLQQIVPGILEAELAAGRQDVFVALEVAERVERDGRVLAEAQAKLLSVVEGVSDELSHTKARSGPRRGVDPRACSRRLIRRGVDHGRLRVRSLEHSPDQERSRLSGG